MFYIIYLYILSVYEFPGARGNTEASLVAKSCLAKSITEKNKEICMKTVMEVEKSIKMLRKKR